MSDLGSEELEEEGENDLGVRAPGEGGASRDARGGSGPPRPRSESGEALSPVTGPPGGRPGRDEGLADHSGRALRPGSPRWKVKRYDVGSPRPFSFPIPPPIKGEDFQRPRERPPLCRYPAQQTVPLGAGLSRAACPSCLPCYP